MSSINNLSSILDDFKTNLQDIYDELNGKIDNLTIANKQLMKENKELKKSKQDIEDELATFKKSSLVAQLNKQLLEQKNQMVILEQQVNHYKANVNTFSKKASSDATIHKLNNDIAERDRYIAILEAKQIEEEDEVAQKVKQTEDKQMKVKQPEVKQQIVEEEEEEIEYQTIVHNKKKYYLVGKKVYTINKDKTQGEIFGRYKNGEVIKKVES